MSAHTVVLLFKKPISSTDMMIISLSTEPVFRVTPVNQTVVESETHVFSIIELVNGSLATPITVTVSSQASFLFPAIPGMCMPALYSTCIY